MISQSRTEIVEAFVRTLRETHGAEVHFDLWPNPRGPGYFYDVTCRCPLCGHRWNAAVESGSPNDVVTDIIALVEKHTACSIELGAAGGG